MSEGKWMTAQTLDAGRFVDVRGAEATDLVVAAFAFGAGFATTAAFVVAFTVAAGLAEGLLTALATVFGASEIVGTSTTAFNSIGGGRTATGVAFGAAVGVGVVATSGEVQRDNHHIAMLLEAATK